MKCEDCRHLRCEKGDRWTPDEWYCDLDLYNEEEDTCDKYSEIDYQDELDKDYDLRLRYEESRVRD